jgi:hypothetical protein
MLKRSVQVLARLFFNRRNFRYHFAFVVQLTFAHMCAVTYMHFAGAAVGRQGSGRCFVVRSAFGTSLLTVSALGIRHNSNIKKFNN